LFKTPFFLGTSFPRPECSSSDVVLLLSHDEEEFRQAWSQNDRPPRGLVLARVPPVARLVLGSSPCSSRTTARSGRKAPPAKCFENTPQPLGVLDRFSFALWPCHRGAHFRAKTDPRQLLFCLPKPKRLFDAIALWRPPAPIPQGQRRSSPGKPESPHAGFWRAPSPLVPRFTV
jgi:hypothetical protein